MKEGLLLDKMKKKFKSYFHPLSYLLPNNGRKESRCTDYRLHNNDWSLAGSLHEKHHARSETPVDYFK